MSSLDKLLRLGTFQPLTIRDGTNVPSDAVTAPARFLSLNGSPAADAALVLPHLPGPWVVRNSTGRSISVRGPTGAPATIPSGSVSLVASDGTDFFALAGGSTSVTAMLHNASLPALRAAPVMANAFAITAGYASVSDGGAGSWVWNATDARADDGGTIVTPTGQVGAGRWNRIIAGNTYDVRWFGAKCDGTTNDATAVTNAINALPAGATLLIPGICAIGASGWTGINVASKNNITIEGGARGVNGFRLLAAPSQTMAPHPATYAIKFTSCTSVRLRRISLDHAGGTSSGFHGGGVAFDTCTNCEVVECHFHDFAGLWNDTDLGLGFSVCIGAFHGSGNVVRDTLFERTHFPIYMGYGGSTGNQGLWESNFRVSGNTFVTTTGDAIVFTAKRGLVSHNTFKDTTRVPIIIGGGLDTCDSITIDSNKSTNSGHGIQCDISVTPWPRPTNIIISNNEIDACGAIANALGASGMYLLGIDGCSISGNTVRNTGKTSTTNGYGIAIDSCARVIVANNRIFDSLAGASRTSNVGISLSDTYYPCDEITIANNYVSNMRAIGIDIAVPVQSTSYTSVSITGNTVRNNSTGIIHRTVQRVHLSDNILTDNTVDYQNQGSNSHVIRGSNNTIGVFAGASASDVIANINHTNRVLYGTAVPAITPVDPWKVGDVVLNSAPPASGSLISGWVCTAAGGAGTWRAIGARPQLEYTFVDTAAATGGLSYQSGDRTVAMKFAAQALLTITGVRLNWQNSASKTVKVSLWDATSATRVATGSATLSSAGTASILFASPYTLTGGNINRYLYLTAYQTDGLNWTQHSDPIQPPGPFRMGPHLTFIEFSQVAGDVMPTTTSAVKYPIEPIVNDF